jgi:hypothetical protein
MSRPDRYTLDWISIICDIIRQYKTICPEPEWATGIGSEQGADEGAQLEADGQGDKGSHQTHADQGQAPEPHLKNQDLISVLDAPAANHVFPARGARLGRFEHTSGKAYPEMMSNVAS